jgi:hypothetical protein
MPIAQEWFIDYQNQLVVHSSYWIYYDTYVQSPGSTDFTAGETITFDTGGTPYTAILVDVDLTNSRLNVVYLSNPALLTNNHTITGGTSGATAAINVSWGQMNSTTIPYDNLAGGNFVVGAATIGADNCYIVADDVSGSELTVVYLSGTIANNDTITQGAVSALVNATSFNVSKTTYTVRQLYSFMQDTFDELVQMDDTVPMSAQTPTEFTMINGWFIDDDSTQYLSGGAISTSGWTGEIQILTLDGTYTDCVPSDIGKQVNNGGDLGPLLHYDNADQKWWFRSATQALNNDTMTITSGTGGGDAAANSVDGETLYANIYTLGTIQTTPNPTTYVFQNGLALSEWWGRGDSEAHIDVLIKVSEADTEIDGAQITVFVRHFADLYDHFPIDLSSGGRNAVPLATQEDLNNNTTGEQILSVNDASSFNVGNFVLGATSGAYGEVLAIDTASTPDTLTIGNIVGASTFTDAETINETIDGTASGVTGVSTTLTAPHKSDASAGYNDIGIYFVNATFNYDSGSVAPTLYERVYQGAGGGSDPSGYVVEYTLGSGTWGGGTAAGTITIANWNSITFADNIALNGETSGADFATADNLGGETINADITKAFEQGTAYPYNIIVDCASRTMSEVYEWFKYVTREDANSTQRNYITMYRVNDLATAIIEEDGEEYISAQTTYTPAKASPFGTFAGGKLFAARGVWVENMDNADRQNFQLIDANNNTRVPPNFITITVNSVVAGDKVTVFRTTSGTAIEKDQFTSDAGNNASDTDFVVVEPIPSDTPSVGHIRVVDVSDTSVNRETRYDYVSWNNASVSGPGTFTLSGGNPSNVLDRNYAASTDTAYVPYYDEVANDTSVSVTVIYYSSQTVLTRVRQYDYGTPANSILPFQITGSVTTSGYTVAAIRTADTIVSTY